MDRLQRKQTAIRNNIDRTIATANELLQASPAAIVRTATNYHGFLEDESLFQFLPSFARNMDLHVFIPPLCLERNCGIVQTFLTNPSLPARMFFTDLTNVPDDPTACHVQSVVDYPFEHQVCNRVIFLVDCGHISWGAHTNRTPPKYASYAIADLTNRTREHCDAHSHDPLCVYLREVDVYVMQTNDNQLSVRLHEEKECETFPPHSTLTTFSQRSLNGAALSLHCLYPTTCFLPSINVFIEALHYRNATVTVKQHGFFDNSDVHFVRRFIKCIGLHGVIYNPASNIRQLRSVRRMHPHATLVRAVGAVQNRQFVKKLDRFPNTVIVILVFQWPLWLALTTCYLSFCFFLTIHSCFYGYPKTSPTRVALWLMSSLLNQNMRLVTATATKLWLRLVVGAWLLISLLMSTVFRGALTTILQNIPTRGRLPEFHTVASKQRLGYSSSYVLCGNNILYERMRLMYNISGAPGVCWAETYERPSSKRVYVMDNMAEELAENLTQILDAFGYVWLGQDTLNWLAGPVVAFGSPYKNSIATVTTQAFEGGLFEVPTVLETFRFKYRREIRLVSRVRVARLGNDSFEPHFIVFYFGFGISLTVFALEIIVSQKWILQFRKNITHVTKF